MVLFEQIKNKQEKICIVGLGYVGLPLAVQFAHYFSVIGFDVKKERIEELRQTKDHTHEVSEDELSTVSIEYSDDPTSIRKAKFIVVAVPTPIKEGNLPDLFLVEKATEMVAKNLSQGSVVVYESTVYPGVTEDICLPILEKFSGLKAGVDFKVGYSPERVNPGDKEHAINKVVKVVSGMDEESTDLIARVYGSITNIFKASSIKVAEAAKVIENTQRDLNVALVNELAMIFQQMDICVYDVLEAAGTKWNFLKFTPGLVGGHCIGVDPYYLTYKAQTLGHHPEVILAGRRINDSMGRYIARRILKTMAQMGKELHNAKIAILGITFKENIPDIRNSKVIDIINEFKAFGIEVLLYDPMTEAQDVTDEYHLTMSRFEDIQNVDAIVVAVAHKQFMSMNATDYKKMMNSNNPLLADVKHIFRKEEFIEQGVGYWSL